MKKGKEVEGEETEEAGKGATEKGMFTSIKIIFAGNKIFPQFISFFHRNHTEATRIRSACQRRVAKQNRNIEIG